MLVVVDENIPQWQLFEQHAQVVRLPGRSITAQDVRDADALIVRSVTQVNQQLLQGSALRFVGTCTIGTDHLDLGYLQQQQIGWSNAPGCNAQAVVEYVLACLQILAQRTGRRLDTLRYGVVGVGQVGSRLVRALRALGVEVLQCDPPRQQREGIDDYVDLPTLLANSDVVSLHVPLDQSTRHLLGRSELELLPADVWLINAARGSVVDNAALLEFLQRRADVQVVLDVWEGEPDFSPQLAQLCQVATPHIAGYSLDGKILGTQMIAQRFNQYFALPATAQTQYPSAPVQTVGLAQDVEEHEQLAALLCLLYQPLADDARFRRLLALPEQQRRLEFDRLRKTYPVRRELATLKSLNGLAPGLHEFARTLGIAV